MSYIIVLFACVLVNNVVFNQIYGICPFLGVSKKTNQAVGMGLAVTFVMIAASAVTWPIQHYLLNGLGLGYLQTILFILVIAAFVQFIEMVLKKFIPSLHKSLGVYLPLITTNCAVLGVTVDNISASYSFFTSLITALGSGLGFLLAMVLFSGVRSKFERNEVPRSWKGLPITLAAAAIVSMCFKGFEGVISIPNKTAAPELYVATAKGGGTGSPWTDVLLAVGIVVGVGFVCAALLMVANRFMHVEEDERFPKIRAILPGANCGACGFAGCDGYANALLNPETPVNLCVPGADDVSSSLADLLGREFADVEEKVAVVRCSGDCNTAIMKSDYAGISSCAAAKLQFGGPKSCIYGCFGFGDCAS
ncbi:MAG: RnfABCDGE type electron transport complex subunit A, partial [Clostridia bacterium]|nr:RnfABCDGE type electron transport complex subunit A [Clostridia bacterium]